MLKTKPMLFLKTALVTLAMVVVACVGIIGAGTINEGLLDSIQAINETPMPVPADSL